MATAQQADRTISVRTDDRTRQFKQILEGQNFQRALAAALPRTIRPERMIRVVLAAFQSNEKILNCTPETVLLSIMRAASMGLEPDGGAMGHGYLVPFWNGKKHRFDCQFIPGYRGLVKLARNSGEIADVWAEVVYEADQFDYELGLEQRLSHKRNDAVDDPGKLRYAYAVARFRDGEKKFVVMNRREVDAVKKRSASRDKQGNIVGPWLEDEPEMWKKTAIRRISKQLPLSPEAATVFSQEDTGESNVAPAMPQFDLVGLTHSDDDQQDDGQETDNGKATGETDEKQAARAPEPANERQESVTSEQTDAGTGDALQEALERFNGCHDLLGVNKIQQELESADNSQPWVATIASMADEARDRVRASRGTRANGK